MPATKFRCPDGEVIPMGDCLTSCRMGRRCLTLPTLITLASSEKPWDGKSSTTRLMNGTLIEWLKIKIEYTIKPQDRAFALLGTNHHERLASIQGNWIAEEKQGNGISGTPDLLEPDELNPGSYVLTDYKTYGSFRVAKLLGLVKQQHLSDTEFYQKSGRWGKAGSPKKITTFRQDINAVDAKDEELQLNHYRVMVEAAGYPITHMQVQVTVRDGGIQVARERGVTGTMYLIPILRLPDDYIHNYFKGKMDKLHYYVDSDTQPPVCTEEESWFKRRCKDYCEVAEHCPQGARVLSGEIQVGGS